MSRCPIPGHPGYEADQNGQIWSVSSNWRGYGVRQMAQRPWKDGYLAVRLKTSTGQRHPFMVHSLVCSAFKGPRPQGKQCRHLDGYKTHNSPDNLEWGTAKENADDRTLHGGRLFGVMLPWTILTPFKVRKIKTWLTGGMSNKNIAILTGVHPSTISQIKRGITWKEVTLDGNS